MPSPLMSATATATGPFPTGNVYSALNETLASRIGREYDFADICIDDDLTRIFGNGQRWQHPAVNIKGLP